MVCGAGQIVTARSRLADLSAAATCRYDMAMTTTKIIAIVVLLLLGFYLLLYSYLKRRITAARRENHKR